MMYAPGPYSLALGLAEIPYLFAQAIVMVSRDGMLAAGCSSTAVFCAASHGLAAWVLRMPQRQGLPPGDGPGREGRQKLHLMRSPSRIVPGLQVNIFYWAVQFSSTAWKFFFFLLMFMVTLVMYT